MLLANLRYIAIYPNYVRNLLLSGTSSRKYSFIEKILYIVFKIGKKKTSRGRVDIVKMLLEKGANKEVKSRNELTPLSIAAHKCYVEVVKMLLESGANTEATESQWVDAVAYCSRVGLC